MPRVDIISGFNSDSSLQFNAMECQNMVPLLIEKNGGKGLYRLRSVWGTEELCKLPTGGSVVGSYVVTPNKYSDSERMFCLISDIGGTKLYEIYENGSFNLSYSSPVATDSSAYCRFADNGEVLCFVNGNNGWFFNLSTGVGALITDLDFPTNPIDVVFLDTYFIWLDNRSSTGNIYISDNYATDPTNCVNALDFTTAESQPDNPIALMVLNNELAVFGNRTIEFFYNSENVDFPFERNSGVTQNVGSKSIETISKINDIILFIGESTAGNVDVYILNGYQANPLRYQSICKVLDDNKNQKQFAFSINEESSFFYCFSTLDKTYCYDTSTGIWSTRISTFVSGTDQPYGSKFKSHFKGSNYFFTTKTIPLNTVVSVYRQDKSVYTTDEINTETLLNEPVNIKRKIVLPHLSNENKEIVYKSFELDIQKGVANVDDSDPTISISMSKDGGMTYGPEKVVRIGGTNTQQRIRIQRLGRGRDVVFKIESDSPVQQEWFTAYLEYEVLND